MEELWKEIKANPNYEVSTLGRVRNKVTKRTLKDRDNGRGYLYVHLYNSGERKSHYVHRLVAENFVSRDSQETEVNHIDGNKNNNTVFNLEWCTPSENNKHAWATGLKKFSEKQLKRSVETIQKVNRNPEKYTAKRKETRKKNDLLKNKTTHVYMKESFNQFKPIKCLDNNRIYLNSRRVSEHLGVTREAIQKSLARGYNTCGGYRLRYISNWRFPLSQDTV